MSTITEKLALLMNTKAEIKKAIEENGVTVGDIPFSKYPDLIRRQECDPYLVYITTKAYERIQIIHKKEYAESITLEDGTRIPINGSGLLDYAFTNVGIHRVRIKFKRDVTNFYDCFSNCTSLVSIPAGLFGGCTAVTDFYGCFYDCTSLTGETPTDKNGNKLWERAGKPGYPEEINGADCFTNCAKLSDYSNIPSDWKGL